jgi:hypothetical protein
VYLGSDQGLCNKLVKHYEGHKRQKTLELGGEDEKIHSKRVGKIYNYTRSEWGKFTTTLEASGENLQLHSKRVEKIRFGQVRTQKDTFIVRHFAGPVNYSVDGFLDKNKGDLPHSFRV